jgi:predicted ATP-binding protein involved in virulence
MTRLHAGRTAFLFIDEGEMFMHPAWQRRYITDLLTFLGKYPEVSSRLHVVLSTHSLIVAADAPPNRLFNVKSGEMVNGFGYGPKDLLDYIYGVREFQGEHAGRLMESLVGHIRNRNSESMRAEVALELASNIADDRLRKYLTNELSRRGEAGGNFD